MTNTDRLSIQLYTLRTLGDLDHVLDATAAAGFRHVELVGSHLDNAAATKAALDARELTVSTSHVSLAALRERPRMVIDACHALRFNELFMPSVPQEQRDMDAAGWRAIGTELADLTETMGKAGITLGYHNHNWEMRKKEGDKTALELIFEAAGTAPLKWQADVAWLVRGDAEPKAWMHRYRERLTSVHVKDIAPAGENVDQDGWADVGSGVLDWPDLWRAAKADGAKWMVVEHDKPADPAASARASFSYISAMKV